MSKLNLEGKPERHETLCSICNKEAIGLYVDDLHIGRSSVEWCELGHVIVLELGNPPKLVHEFGGDYK